MRNLHADKLLGDMTEFAAEMVRDRDNMTAAAWRARDLRDILVTLPPEQRENVSRALRRYLWAVYDGARPPPDDQVRPGDTGAATKARLAIGDRKDWIVCARADLLRQERPGITMRQAALEIADTKGAQSIGRVYKTIRRAFSEVWDDPDEPFMK